MNARIGDIDGAAFDNVTLGGSSGLNGSGVAPTIAPSTDFASGIQLNSWEDELDSTLRVDDLTLEIWVQTTTNSSTPQALAGTMAVDDNNAGGGYALELTSSEIPRGTVYLETTTSPFWQEVVLEGTSAINDGAPHHLALTKNSSTARLYVDGILVDFASSGGLDTYYAGCFCSGGDEAQVWVGRRLVDGELNPRTFSGVVDEVAIYDKALTSGEVAEHAGHEELYDDQLGDRSSSGYGSDPVNTLTGNFTQEIVDLDFPNAIYGMDFVRTYNAQDPRSRGLGVGWTFAHDTRIEGVDGDGIVSMVSDEGRVVEFEPDGSGGYERPIEFYGDLIDDQDGSFSAEMFDGSAWDFNSAGELIELSNWDGQVVTVTQGTNGPTQIASNAGYTLTVGYDGSGHIDEVASSDGREITFVYDGNLLEDVTGADGGVTIHSYNADNLLETITDPEDVDVVINTYDTQSRVVEQDFPGGQSVTFSYAGLETTMTHQPSGEVLIHEYNTAGMLIRIEDPYSEELNLTRSAEGELTGATSRLGEVLTQIFDANGNVLTSETTTGGEIEYTYDTQNRVTSMTQPWGATTTYTYSGEERVPTTVTDELNETTTYTVTNGLVTSVEDPDGVETTYTYDSTRRLLTETNGDSKTTTHTYDSAGRLATTTTPLSNTTTYTYDDAGRLLTTTDPEGGVTTYTYDDAGRLLTVTDPESDTTTNAYDTAGRLSTTTDSRSDTTTYSYDSFDQVVTTTRPGSAVTTNSWEELGRLESVTDPISRTTSYGYDEDGNQATVADPTSDTTTNTHDSAGRVLTTTDPLNRTTTSTYDSSGRLSTVTDPEGGLTTYTYDTLGRTSTVTDPEGGVTTTTYTPGGRVATVTGPENGVTTYTYDDAGRLLTVTDPEGGIASYTYDDDGRVTAIESPEGLAASTTFDGAGRPLTRTTPAGVTTTHTYNDRGDLVGVQLEGQGTSGFDYDDRDLLSVTDPLGETTTFGYDGRGNRTSMTDALNRSQTATYALDDQITSTTDALNRTTITTYDADGRVDTITYESGRSVTYTYDDAGQLIEQEYSDSTTITYGYDDNGRRTQMVDPTGTTTYTYDDNGNLTSVTYPNNDTLSYSYDDAGRRTQLTYPDSTTITYTYDDNGRVTGLTRSGSGSAAYTYDDDGRLLTETISDGTARSYAYTDGQVTSYTQNSVTTNLTYDNSGRVASTTGGEAWTFTYDQAGQLTAATGPTGTHSYSYDEVGNLTSKDGTTYTTDAANQLVSDSSGGTYTYDDDGRLTEYEASDGTITTYTYSARGLLTTQEITEPGGIDESICDTATPTITGTSGDDQLQGTNGDDIIFGLAGDDNLRGNGGNDIICGGTGSDLIRGDDGNDILIGGGGEDTLRGDTGDDYLFGGIGDDQLTGSYGDDYVEGGAGGDSIQGSSGDDILDGGTDTDHIAGGADTDECEDEPTRIECESDLTGPGGATSTTTIERSYDGDGLLANITIILPDVTQEQYDFTWDRNLPIPQIVSIDNGTTTQFSYGPNRAFGITGSTVTGYDYSVFGDTTSGPLSAGAEYDPYGTGALGTTDIGFGYRGELHVGDHAYLRFRDLDPTTGRFTTGDPLSGVPGTTTVTNRYAYANNDPLNLMDPLGLSPSDSDLAITLKEAPGSPILAFGNDRSASLAWNFMGAAWAAFDEFATNAYACTWIIFCPDPSVVWVTNLLEFAERSGDKQEFDPKPMLEQYLKGPAAPFGGEVVVDVGDPKYLYYYDVLGNVMWGVIAGNELKPLPDNLIIWCTNHCPNHGLADAGDDAFVGAGSQLGKANGTGTTLGQVLTAIRDLNPELLAKAKGNIDLSNASKNKIVDRKFVPGG